MDKISSVLVATDAFPEAMGALRVARVLAERDRARVEVLTVFDPPMPFYGLEPVAVAGVEPSPFGGAAAEHLRQRVEAQIAQVGGVARGWPITLKRDRRAPAIARFARDCGASLVLMGLRPHVAVERWLGRETLLSVVHLSHVPVLAVPLEAEDLPRRIVAAVDLSALSVRAVENAIRIAPPGGELHLAHGTWAPQPVQSWATMEWVKTYRTAIEKRIEGLASEVRRSSTLDVHVHILGSGEPARQILALADEVGAGMIATGSHGHGYMGRIVLGSVSSRLLHGARCAVLVAPPAGVPPELGGGRIRAVEREGEAVAAPRVRLRQPG